MSRKYGVGDSPEEVSAALASASFDLRQASAAEEGFRKLHTAMASIGLSKTPRQLKLIAAAIEYLDSEIAESLPRQLKHNASVVRNELLSLADGIKANAVSQEEMFLVSSLTAATDATKLVASIKAKMGRLTAGQPVEAESVPADILRRNAKYRNSLPDLSQKSYGVARVPVTFAMRSGSSQNQHTSVGYLNPDVLSHLGIKAELLDGYAVVHGQVVIGIGRDMLEDTDEVTLEDGTVQKNVLPKMVNERVTKFTKDTPSIVLKRRKKTVLDAAMEVKSLLERHTNTKYSLVSEKSFGYKGQSYFWLMQSNDLTRFARAFSGGSTRIHAWGFAF